MDSRVVVDSNYKCDAILFTIALGADFAYLEAGTAKYRIDTYS